MQRTLQKEPLVSYNVEKEARDACTRVPGIILSPNNFVFSWKVSCGTSNSSRPSSSPVVSPTFLSFSLSLPPFLHMSTHIYCMCYEMRHYSSMEYVVMHKTVKVSVILEITFW